MRSIETFFKASDDAEIFYKVYGKGDPLFLISGLSGTSDSFNNIVPYLGRFFTVITIDNRGSGRTKCDFKSINIDRMADDVKELSDALGFPIISLLGFSMGGYVGQLFALKYQGMLKKLILSHTSPKPLERSIEILQTMADSLEDGISWRNWHKIFSHWIFTAEFFDNKEFYELAIEFGLNYEPHQTLEGFRAQLGARLNYDVYSSISKIKAETLIIAGKQDILCPSYLSENMAAQISGSNLLLLEDAHMPIVENKDKYLQTIMDFLIRK